MESNTQRPESFPNLHSTKPNSTNNPFQPFTTAPITPPPTPPHYRSDTDFDSAKSQQYFHTFSESQPTASTPNPSPEATSPQSNPQEPSQNNNNTNFYNNMYKNIYQDTGRAAIGILYCPQCDRGFGNKLVFQRHFMFAPSHRDVDRSSLGFYYKLWRHSWKAGDGDELEGDGNEGRFEEVYGQHEGDMGPEPEGMEDVRTTPEPDLEG